MDEQQILERLSKELARLDDLGEDERVSALKHDLTLYEEWLEKGKPPPCPIQLETWGIQAVEAIAEAQPSETSPGGVEDAQLQETLETRVPSGQTAAGEEVEDAGEEIYRFEEQQFQKMLKDMRAKLESKEDRQLVEALVQAKSLASRKELSPTDLAELNSLIIKLQDELNLRLKAILDEGDRARENNLLDKADAAYRKALQLDPENLHVNQGLKALQLQQGAILNQEKIRDLRFRLRNREDIEILEEAVREAEAYQDEGLLPGDLLQLAQEARRFYDKTRREHGEITTQMRYGTLSESKNAVTRLQNLRRSGATKKIKDPVSGFTGITQSLEEANYFWEQRSRELVEYTITKINKYLPARPLIAKDIYGRALQEEDPRTHKIIDRPFYGSALDVLREKETEIREHLEHMRQAESLLEQATKEKDDLVAAFRTTLRARDTFPYLVGINEQVERARLSAISYLVTMADSAMTMAKADLSNYIFGKARQGVSGAKILLRTWPEKQLPDDLTRKLEELDELDQQITLQESQRGEFLGFIEEIKEKRKVPQSLPLAFKLLASLDDDPRFNHYPEMRTITLDMDDFRGVDDQLAAAREAASKADWERVERLTKDKIDTLQEEELRHEFRELYDRAVLEMQLARAVSYLEKDEIFEANKIFSRLADSSSKFTKEVNERYSHEIDLIREAIQHPAAKALEGFLKTADAEADKKGFNEKLRALRMYRYLSGENITPEEGWPPHRLSLATAPARKKAMELAEAIRSENLPKLAEWQKVAATKSLKPDDLKRWASVARKVREAGLLHSEEEREVVRWFEIGSGEQNGQEAEQRGDWDRAVQIWKNLDTSYPLTPQVQQRLHQARIQQAVQKVQSLIAQGKPDSALQVLEQLQEEPAFLREGLIHLAFAEAYGANQQYGEAYKALQRAERDEQMVKKASEIRQRYQRDQAITEALDKSKQAATMREAILILQEAQKNPRVGGSGRLVHQANTLYTDEKRRLNKRISEELDKNTYDGKMDALIALFDLRGLEELMMVADQDSAVLPQIQTLADDFRDIARKLIKDGRVFNLEGKHVQDAYDELKEIIARFDVFERVVKKTDQKMGEEVEQIRSLRPQKTQLLERLERLIELLAEIRKEEKWSLALDKGDFREIEGYQAQIHSLELSGLIEPQEFDQKLHEWKGLYEYLAQKILAIKDAFSIQEDFQQVQTKLIRLSKRPDSLPNISRFIQVQQGEYQQIYERMGRKLLIADLYGPDLAGWDSVKRAAEERGAEAAKWQAWSEEVKGGIDRLKGPYQATQNHREDTKLGVKQSDWKIVLDIARETLAIAEKPPQMAQDGQLVAMPIRSERAETIQEEGKQNRKDLHEIISIAENHLKNINQQIEQLGDFPSAQELNDLVNRGNYGGLEIRLQQAERIGPANPEEEKRLRIYQRILEKQNQNGSNGLIQRIFGRKKGN